MNEVEQGLEIARERVLRERVYFPNNPDEAFEIGYRLGFANGRGEGYGEGYGQGHFDGVRATEAYYDR